MSRLPGVKLTAQFKTTFPAESLLTPCHWYFSPKMEVKKRARLGVLLMRSQNSSKAWRVSLSKEYTTSSLQLSFDGLRLSFAGARVSELPPEFRTLT